jgi:CheY-like chemotaxis protein
MAAKRWDVLVVDDEDDILTVSKLALKNIKVYGLALNVITAKSKADAIERLKKLPPSSALAVAFIDVVMESETAGLELCQYIREEMHNKITKLIVRTGQAGKAPEVEVIDRYDISGYMSKVDATDDKLYSTVKSSIREHVWAKCASQYYSLTHEVVASASSQDGIVAALRRRLSRVHLDGAPTDETHCAFFVDGKVIVSTGEYEASDRAIAARDAVGSSRGLPLDEAADNYVGAPSALLVRLPAAAPFPDLQVLVRTGLEVPDFIVSQFMYPFLKSLRQLWKLAGDRGGRAS